MSFSTIEPRFLSPVRVERVSLRGSGVVILTGPSSCGKGEVANVLCDVMSIDRKYHLSMGEILRNAFRNAKSDKKFAKLLAEKHGIGETNIFESEDGTDDLRRKIHNYLPDLERYFNKPGMDKNTTQLEWLEFCVMQGLLVPNRWTQEFVAIYIENNPEFLEKPFILDGYPRTVVAAKHLLQVLNRLHIPVVKVLHLSISKQEMLYRARQRGREDDDEEALLSRFQFYIESVQPSVDYLKTELGPERVALIDAHQPIYRMANGRLELDLGESIAMVVKSALRSLGVPRTIVHDLMEERRVRIH